MKHYSHIYIALKAVQFLKQAVDGMGLKGTAKAARRNEMTTLQGMLYEQIDARGAAWAPDAILKDMHPNHVFKLVSPGDFPDYAFRAEDAIGDLYYWSGSLPDRIVVLADRIKEFQTTRQAYQEAYSLRDLAYTYYLLSHYVADAHVPMHCDLRDDPPGKGDTEKPRGTYLASTAHAKVEALWEDAVTPIAIQEGLIHASWDKINTEPTELTPSVTFSAEDGMPDAVQIVPIAAGCLRGRVVDMCVESHAACHRLFPTAEMDQAVLAEETRRVFGRAIGDLIAVWDYCWRQGR